MTNPYSRLIQIPDATMTAFARGAAHCGGKMVQDFEAQPPAQLLYNDVGREWAAISQKPISSHTIAQLRWIMCDTDDALFRCAELNYNYYVRRDKAGLHQLGLVLGQITNVMHAQDDSNAVGVEALQNRITTIENEVLASSDIRDWGRGKIALTGALWAVGVGGSFIFLSAAFGIGVHKAPMVYAAASKKWRKWRNKDDNDPKPPAASGGMGAGTAATSAAPELRVVQRTAISPATPTPWKGWDPSATGYAQDDWAGTLLTCLAVFAAIKALPVAAAASARVTVPQPQAQPRPEPLPWPFPGLQPILPGRFLAY